MAKIKEHSDVFKCSNCFVRFGTQLDFFTHTQDKCELSGDFFKCEICQFKTKSRTGMVSHQQKHDREKSHIECKFCKKRKMFKSRKTFLVHVNHYHQEHLNDVKEIMENYDKKVREREAEKAFLSLTPPKVPTSEVPLPVTPQLLPTFDNPMSPLNSTPGAPIVHFLDFPLNVQLPQIPQFPDIAHYFNLNFN